VTEENSYAIKVAAKAAALELLQDVASEMPALAKALDKRAAARAAAEAKGAKERQAVMEDRAARRAERAAARLAQADAIVRQGIEDELAALGPGAFVVRHVRCATSPCQEHARLELTSSANMPRPNEWRCALHADLVPGVVRTYGRFRNTLTGRVSEPVTDGAAAAQMKASRKWELVENGNSPIPPLSRGAGVPERVEPGAAAF
jgi:hypothetical protein